MMRKFLKILIICLIVIVLASCAFGIAVFLKYKSVTAENLPVKFVKSQVLPEEEAPLGDVLSVVFTINSPWNKVPVSSEVKAAQGSQIIDKVQYVKIRNSWGLSTWEVIVKVQSFTTGLIPEGELKLFFSPDKDGKKDVLDLKIPEITSLEIKNVTDKPLTASREEIKPIIKSKAFYYGCGIAIIIIIALILWFVFRKRKEKPRILTPWEKAILALNAIKLEFVRGELSPIKCLLKLTDEVRSYLEERFNIHAPKQTTEEFMSGMENSSSPLTNSDRNFLREFMQSADMIKFAKYDADKAMIEHSIERALLLIAETTPVQNENKIEAEKKA